ncbi:MAG: asparagine--tRNA ligase [Candidatus Binatia bacterium]|nr:asparagine--tRNA ligase [Candidatus Binatia bacterium]
MVVAHVSEVAAHAGQVVTVRGWLAGKRSSGKLLFLQVRDGTGTMQCTAFRPNLPPEVFEEAKHLPQESSLTVTGNVNPDERAPGGFELQIEEIRVVAPADEYPITPKEHGTAFLLDRRHLWLRSSRQHAIMRIRASVVRACRSYFDDRNFTLIDAPIFTPAACEGTTTLFPVDYFGERVYLTQSGQLYMEAGAMAFGKAYCLGPTFRAEKSKTRRHLTEFWMIEPEVAYLDLDGDMDLAEDFIVSVVARVLEEKRDELELLERDVAALEKVQKPFPRVTYDEAIEALRGLGHTHEWGDDLGAEEETVLASQYDRPVMVHRYPAACKAFYMKNDPAAPHLALCVDVLAPEGYGEIIGGGQREDDLEVLRGKIAEHDLPFDPFEWYLDLRRYGSVPHAGFGMGIERMVAWLCGIHHVRETIAFPRMLERTTP